MWAPVILSPNDWRAKNAASNSRIFICLEASEAVHLPPISWPSNTAPHPFFDASDCMITLGKPCDMCHLACGMCDTHQCNSSTDVSERCKGAS